MRLVETLRIVWINLMQNKFKVLLTSLGIIVGAVTIVMVIAIGKGGEAEIAGQFQGLSAETIYVNPDYSKTFSTDMELSDIPKLSLDNMRQMLDENSYLKDITMRSSYFKDVVMNGQKGSMQVAGVLQNYEQISNLFPAEGVNISEEDVEYENRVAVIGDGLAQKYFKGPEDAIGKTIKIGEQQYQIVGVLERKGDGMQGVNPDDTIFIPFTTAERFLADPYTIPQVVAMADSVNHVAAAMKQMQGTLDYILEDGSIYMLEDAGSRIDAAMESARTMNLLLISVAAIVFIVGGIGIMNVLFVSVKERTREIGILKALGSSKRDIMTQFLLESVIISLFGGIVGVALSYACMPLMDYTDIPVLPTVDGQVIALLFAVATGTLFGFYPAYKASRLKPIDALNYE
ncbi:ABC transporter permease [Christensenella intestinihominis]|uniref:ABC transporter permease n=1 Tax=Christensenella intestinihominis TaxID=1851429 RepID=UPI00083422A9|nr:ABC transporter permease [Christensenella intestinihominis]